MPSFDLHAHRGGKTKTEVKAEPDGFYQVSMTVNEWQWILVSGISAQDLEQHADACRAALAEHGPDAAVEARLEKESQALRDGRREYLAAQEDLPL